MNYTDQSIKGLEAAYLACYRQPLKQRVAELCRGYPDPDRIHSELNPDNSVPCFWKVTELAWHYGIEFGPKACIFKH